MRNLCFVYIKIPTKFLFNFPFQNQIVRHDPVGTKPDSLLSYSCVIYGLYCEVFHTARARQESRKAVFHCSRFARAGGANWFQLLRFNWFQYERFLSAFVSVDKLNYILTFLAPHATDFSRH